jgi:Lipase (class 3)
MQPESFWFESSALFIINTVFASLQILALTIMSIYFVRRIVRATLTGKRWSHRRLRGVQLTAVELILQLLNSIFFLIPNADSIVHECKWFSSLVVWMSFGQWTIWNSFFLLFLVQASNMMPVPQRKLNEDQASKQRWWWPFPLRPFSLPVSKRCVNPVAFAEAQYTTEKEPTIYMDAPYWVHWPKLILWSCMEAFLLGLSIDLDRHPAGVAVNSTSTTADRNTSQEESCRYLEYEENFTTVGNVLSSLIAATSIIYLFFYTFLIFYCFRIFYALPYTKFRMANLIIRLQVRQRALTFAFFIATIIVYFYFRRGTLAALILSWYGLTPMQIVNTIVVISQVYLSSPKKPEQTAILQVWLQEFAWTEDDIPRKRSDRISSLPDDSFEGFCMDCEPLFCFETAVKLMYWSFLAYDTGELPNSPFSSATALGLYNLDHFDVVWERALNTKAVIGWTDDPSCATVVIAFRGTASTTNLLADLQVWRTRYPKGIGTPLLGTAPLVHQGFLNTYTRNGFNDRLLSKVQHILNRCQDSVDAAAIDKKEKTIGSAPKYSEPKPPIKVIVTGHSLGGALAVLCAYDIATRTPCAAYDIDISCYTFGAPRVGNHAWAREYNSKISETWQLINSDDVVTRAGKFFILFKHVGHRVLLNRRGDLVVRPSFVEYSLRRSPGGSVKDHYLSSYERAVVAVLAAQFGRKSFDPGSKEGARALAHSAGRVKLLDRAGLSLEDVERLEEGKGQLTRQKSPKASGKKKRLVGVSRVGEEEEEEGAAPMRRRAEEETGLWLKPRIREWWDTIAGTCLGRHELEPIVAREDRSIPYSTSESEGASAAATAAEVAAAESGTEEVSEEERKGIESAVVAEDGQMEVRQRAETGLLHCREMCSEMGASTQKGKRCSLNKSGKSRGGGQGSGSGGGPRP